MDVPVRAAYLGDLLQIPQNGFFAEGLARSRIRAARSDLLQFRARSERCLRVIERARTQPKGRL